MAWTFHAPDGAFKNHSLSSDIRREALANSVTMQFLRMERGFGRKKGEAHTITRILRLPRADRVGETDRLPSGRPQVQTKSVSVSLWGFKIPMTELEEDLNHFNMNSEWQRSLRDQIRLTMDFMAAEAFKKTPYKFIPTTTGGVFDTDGTPSTLADRNCNVAMLRRIYDELSGPSLKVPKFRNDKYAGIISTRCARGIKNDPEYKDWLAPSTQQPLLTGQLPAVGIEGFDLFETNNDEAWADLVGSSTTTGEAVFFGDDAAGLLQIRAPEIRAGLPEELGTLQTVGWVGTLEAFLTWEEAARARVIHVSSS